MTAESIWVLVCIVYILLNIIFLGYIFDDESRDWRNIVTHNDIYLDSIFKEIVHYRQINPFEILSGIVCMPAMIIVCICLFYKWSYDNPKLYKK